MNDNSTQSTLTTSTVAPSAMPVFDGHNDTLLNLYAVRGAESSFLTGVAKGHIDLPRSREGGLGGGFFAIYVPADPATAPKREEVIIKDGGYEVPMAAPVDQPYAQRVTIGMLALALRIERESEGQVKIVRNSAELADSLARGVLAMVLHMEGAEGIDTDLDALEVFYQAGLRSLGLVWSRPNAFATGVPFGFPKTPDTGPGLTDIGKNLVKACNRLGVMIDLSHLNEKGFWDVAKLSDAPLVATHTAVWQITRSTRNLLDTQLDAIKESDGMVGLNFHVSDLWPDASRSADIPLDIMIRHLDYLVERIGIDRVGFGSDFDGATMPAPIKDVSGLPVWIQALRDHGYDDAALNKLTHENWQRVLKKTWKD